MASYEGTLVAVTPASSGQPTYTELCGLPITSLRILDELGGPGLITLGTEVDKIDVDAGTRLLDLSVTPCELWIRKTTSVTATAIVAAGPVTGCRIEDRTLTLTAPGLLSYLGYWAIDANVIASVAASAVTEYVFQDVDQALIVKRLVDAWQALSFGSDGIGTTLLAATGVTQVLTVSALHTKGYLPVLSEMGHRGNGFDLTVDPASRQLTIWAPRKGNDLTGSVILDRRSIGKPVVDWSVAPGKTASEMFASASSTLGPALTSTQSNTTLRSTFGRSYATRQFDEVSVQATLDDHAARALLDTGSQLVTVAPELLPVAGFGYGDFATGDLIQYDFDAGLGRQNFNLRVASIEMSIVSGRETLKVGML